MHLNLLSIVNAVDLDILYFSAQSKKEVFSLLCSKKKSLSLFGKLDNTSLILSIANDTKDSYSNSFMLKIFCSIVSKMSNSSPFLSIIVVI